MDGTNPKFEVHDENGVQVEGQDGGRGASGDRGFTPGLGRRLFCQRRLLPAGVARGRTCPPIFAGDRNSSDPEVTFHNVRLKRYLKDEKKAGDWQVALQPFLNTRELNGLRVMMALINNWDVKDEQQRHL